MLDVYILPSGMPHSDFNKTAESLEKLRIETYIIKVNYLREVTEGTRHFPYYSFFFDNEHINENLQESIGIFLNMNIYDVLVLYKQNVRTGFAEFRPRIFRDRIKLNLSTMTPVQGFGVKTEDVLNGWIIEHGFENLHQIPKERLHEVVKGNG
jgi:hypothetical protein